MTMKNTRAGKAQPVSAAGHSITVPIIADKHIRQRVLFALKVLKDEVPEHLEAAAGLVEYEIKRTITTLGQPELRRAIHVRAQPVSVREWFGLYGVCREVPLAQGAHAPIALSVEQMNARTIIGYARSALLLAGSDAAAWARTPDNAPALKIEYCGHREDLVTLGCVPAEMLVSYGRWLSDPRGAVLYLESKASRGNRGRVRVVYWTQSRSLAAALPGLSEHCADWLSELADRPLLRLVVDNTREADPD